MKNVSSSRRFIRCGIIKIITLPIIKIISSVELGESTLKTEEMKN